MDGHLALTHGGANCIVSFHSTVRWSSRPTGSGAAKADR